MPKKKSNRGGARKGAGRPKLADESQRVVTLTAGVRKVNHDRLAALIFHGRFADGSFPTPGQVLDRLIEAAHPQAADE